MFNTAKYPTITSDITMIRTSRFSLSRSDVLVAVLMFFTLLLGGYFRFVGQEWDDFARFHPDERFLAEVASLLDGPIVHNPSCETWDTNCLERLEQVNTCLQRYPETGGMGGYFDTLCSRFNPENVKYPYYVYGTLPLFMTRTAGEIAVDITGNPVWVTYDGIFQVWRTLSAIADMIVIWLIFLIGMRLHGKWVGLLAAILYAAAVTPIQQSHFGTTDAITNMFVTLAIFFAVRTQDTGSLWDYAAFGLALGAGVASRVNVAPLAGVIIVVAVLRGLPAFDMRLTWNERNKLFTWHFGGLVLAAVCSIVVFRLFQPYAFKGPGIFGILPDERYLKTLAQAQYSVSGEMDSPPNWQWVNRTGYLFAWQNIVLWGMGIALGLMAWISWAWSGWRLIFGRSLATRNIVPFVWILGYFAFAGNLWVMSMRYYLPLYPVLSILAAWGLVELVRRTQRPSIATWRKVIASLLVVGVTGFTILWALMFTNIYRHMATFTQSSHWVWENVPGDFAMRIDGTDPDVPLINIPIWNSYVTGATPLESWLYTGASRLNIGIPVTADFVAPATGSVSTIYAPHIGDPNDLPDEKTLQISIMHSGTEVPIATATLSDDFDRLEHVVGSSYELTFDSPLQVEEGQTYTFKAEVVQGSTLISAGSVMALESAWEEAMPAKVCVLPDGLTLADDPPSGLNSIANCNGQDVFNGLLNGYLLETHWEDEAYKRDRFQTILDQTDYVMIPTNRRYDTQSRIPARWPMTNRMYEALFSGELGFDLEVKFQETFEFGPFRVSDQYLPTYDAPAWLNEFEPEEAFSVYDHPVVFIFKKNPQRYSSENTIAILTSVSLNRVDSVFGGYNDPTLVDVMTLSSLNADVAPTHLMMTKEMQSIQSSGGTWTDRFDRQSLVNSNQVFAVMAWWLAIMVFGWAAFPLLFVAMPALADRGYGLAKFAGILLIAWGTWFLASLRIPVWSQAGIFMGLVIMAMLSVWIVVRNREKFWSFVQSRWKLLLGIEGITFILYVIFIGVRITNPDLWHMNYGGEKPMDFAYFNGVLRSTIFPAIDPWFSGGYLNYYYFGFVIVGTPTLLLSVMPSLAYNLIIPTLFSLTGIAAFSVAFNIASGWRTSISPAESSEIIGEESDTNQRFQKRPMGNPLVAGIMALLLAVVLGNLDTARIIGNGIARLGGYSQPISPQNYLTDEYIDDYGVQPEGEALTQIVQRAGSGRLDDRLRYELHNITSLVGGLFVGFGKLIGGDPLYISPDRWFWAPTRTITEIPNSGDGAINEMPYFTFLYGDLHAHMIAMPMMIFTLAFVYNELMAAGRDRRTVWARVLAIFFGALTVGMFQATNAWDFPTFMILSVLGLCYAWWLGWQQISRWSLLSLLTRVGGFVALAMMVVMPFTWWFASGLTQFKVWEGNKTPLWAYFMIHGLFLVLAFSLLVWETARWMRSVKVADLRGKLPLIWALLAAIGMVLLGSLILAMIDYQVALIVVPMVAWIAILFFRPGQSRPMQFILVLMGLALSITLGTEVITLAFDNGRQNTIFKFYMQVWLILSVVGGVAFSWIIRNSTMWRLRIAVPWFAIVGILVFVAALFPIQATRGKAAFRQAQTASNGQGKVPITLDGMEYMLYANHFEEVQEADVETFSLADDYQIIRWLQDNVSGTPVIMEALSYRLMYQWGGRISINTGLPSVVGWDYHQKQQRSVQSLPSLVSQRVANVNAFYTTGDVTQAIEILRHYNVSYVIYGTYEGLRYQGLGGFRKFDEMVESNILTPVYQQGETVIYQVNQGAVWQAHLEAATAMRTAGKPLVTDSEKE